MFDEYIYVAESGSGLCKIGRTHRPENRIKQLEKHFGVSMTKHKFFKVNGSASDAEYFVHKQLSSC